MPTAWAVSIRHAKPTAGASPQYTRRQCHMSAAFDGRGAVVAAAAAAVLCTEHAGEN